MRVIEQGLIYDSSTAAAERKCAAFTGLTQTSDGTLLCSFKVGPQKLSTDDNICIMHSSDAGRTWREIGDGFPSTFQGVPGSFSSGYLFEKRPGGLLIALVWVDRSHPERPLANPETTGVLPMKCLLAESTDGESWGPVREVSLKPHRGASLTSEIIRLDDGTLMLPYESWKEWDDREGRQSANVRFSKDDGQTWSDPVVMASDPAQQRYFWDNRLAKHPATGRVVALYWTHKPAEGVDDVIHISWSDERGRHWSPPEPTGIAGQIAAPLPLGGSELLCCYVHRHDPSSIRAVVSHDLGKTWDSGGEIVLYQSGSGREPGTESPRYDADYWEDMVRWTFGHPKAVLLPEGSVLAAFYGGDGRRLDMHYAKIDLDT